MTLSSNDLLRRLLALHPKEIDMSLDRLTRLLADLGNPERRLPPTLHVAGTNGKGSTIALMRAALETAGLSIHVYSSPHLVNFHERIRLGGTLITETVLKDVLDEVEHANAGQAITFFEATTAAAFLAFSRTPADVLLLEVGLGGRLDATNVIDAPRLSLITPIAMDHERFLGNTIASIAREKAGILRPGVPAIIAPQDPAAHDEIKTVAHAVGCPVTMLDHTHVAQAPHTGLPGAHQAVNAAVAAAALRHTALQHTGWVSDAHIQQGFQQACWPARLQRLAHGPLTAALHRKTEVWLDGGHNPQAGQMITAFLTDEDARDPRPLHMIIGMLNTKASDGFIAALAPLNPTTWTVPIPDTNASRSAEEVATIAQSQGLVATACTDVYAAIQNIAQKPTTPAPRVLIVGSLYLAGTVLKANHQAPT